MSNQDPADRRRLLTSLASGLVLAVSSSALGSLVAGPAMARDGEDRSGRDGDGDRDDDGDDDGGRGRGRGRGGDDRDDEDEDRDDSGPGGGHDDDSGGSDAFTGGEGPDDRSALGRPRDIVVYYPDGWIERIVSGRYELIDRESRLVVARAATAEDFARMIALR